MSTTRRRLPPGARKVILPSGTVRYELTVDIGPDPRTGNRRQKKRRYATEEELLTAYFTTRHEVATGTHVVKSRITLDQVCDDYLAGRRLAKNTLANYANVLKPLRRRHGHRSVQTLTKRHLDDLVNELVSVGFERADGKRRAGGWSNRSVNLMLKVISMVLKSAMKQGLVARDVSADVDRRNETRRKTAKAKVKNTFTAAEVTTFLAAVADDRNEHAWHLALCGLRRGEIAGLRWEDVDLEAGSLEVVNTRVSVDGQVDEKDPKTDDSGRELPLTPELTRVLRAAQIQQKTERLALGAEYDASGYVVVNEAGQPYHPETLSTYWLRAVRIAGLRRITLHYARHTCGTLMHLQGVPIVVIAAWLGHSDPSFTLRTYAHSQPNALHDAAAVLAALMGGNQTAV
jgi:integrase